jgi:hypothetical protein
MNATTRITVAITLGAFAVALGPSARAQCEVAPDHFDSPDMVPFDPPKAAAASQPTASVEYSGKVTLSHRVRVNGKSIAPGQYAVSLRSDGKTVEVRLVRSGDTVATYTAIYRNVPSTERGYVVVERRGNVRRVSVIHAGSLQLVFARELDASARNTGAATLEVLPLAFTPAAG